MSRRAFLPRAAPASTSLTPTVAVTTLAAEAATRVALPHVPAGRGTPEIASPATTRAQGATGRDVGAVLARMADLHNQLAHAHRDLSEVLQNCLDDARDSRLMSSVETTNTPARLLTAADLADVLQVDAKTIRRWRKTGKIPAGIEISGVIRWRREEIEGWLAR